jgi:hypothetical protein
VTDESGTYFCNPMITGPKLWSGTADNKGMKQRRRDDRNMCADLLQVRWTDDKGRNRAEVAVLEDISTTGVCLKLEHPVREQTEVSLHYPNGKYAGKVKYCKLLRTEFLIGIAFDEGYRWSKADFVPSHLLELPPLITKK